MSPTARSLKYLRQQGMLAGVVERFNPGARCYNDLFGFIDIVVLDGAPGVLGVQTTTVSNQAARMTKITSDALAEPIRRWLGAGNRIHVHGWAKKGPRGKRKTWQVSVTAVPTELPQHLPTPNIEDFPDEDNE